MLRKEYYLGPSARQIGYDLNTVQDQLRSAQYRNDLRCACCGNTPHVQLVPKDPSVATAELETKGYLCMHCLSISGLNPNLYGIRKLE